MERIMKVTDAVLDKCIQEVEAIKQSDINPAEFSIFEYQGFDPILLIKKMISINAYYKGTAKDLLSDIRFAIAAVFFMGNLDPRKLIKRKDEGKQKIEYLVSKYDIQVGSTGTGIAPEIITFPRVSASFPALSVRMANRILPKAVNLDFQSGMVPYYMRTSAFHALCSDRMDSELRMMLMEACNAFSADMSISYEKGRLKKQKKEVKYDLASIAKDQWEYAEIASTSPVPSEDTKISVIMELDLPSKYKEIAEVVSNYRSKVNKIDRAAVTVLSKEEFDTHVSGFVTSSI